MGIKVGDIDISNEIIELWFQVIRTQRALDYVVRNVPTAANALTAEVISQIDNETIAQLQLKFPNMGVTRGEPPQR